MRTVFVEQAHLTGLEASMQSEWARLPTCLSNKRRKGFVLENTASSSRTTAAGMHLLTPKINMFLGVHCTVLAGT